MEFWLQHIKSGLVLGLDRPQASLSSGHSPVLRFLVVNICYRLEQGVMSSTDVSRKELMAIAGAIAGLYDYSTSLRKSSRDPSSWELGIARPMFDRESVKGKAEGALTRSARCFVAIDIAKAELVINHNVVRGLSLPFDPSANAFVRVASALSISLTVTDLITAAVMTGVFGGGESGMGYSAQRGPGDRWSAASALQSRNSAYRKEQRRFFRAYGSYKVAASSVPCELEHDRLHMINII